jgi:hypothetical protein
MDRLTENIELLHHFSFGCLLSHDLLVDGLQSDKFTGKSMYCEVYFSEGTFTYYFPNSVILTLGCRRLTTVIETLLDLALQLGHNFRSRR